MTIKSLPNYLQEWVDPRVVIGPTATGEYYFPRPDIEKFIWAEIDKGSHVLLVAPRRVGKSSIMIAMKEHCPENTKCLFRNIQGIGSEEEFYRAIFEMLVSCLNEFGKGKRWLNSLLKNTRIREISLSGGIRFESEEPHYAEEIGHVLPRLADQKLRIVLLIDELPEMLNNLYRHDRKDEAARILDRLREWRQHPVVRYHLSLVLAGSVGLHHIVRKIEGRTADINDPAIVSFNPLTHEEAVRYIAWATENASVQYDDHLVSYLLEKVRYYIPYFINLMLDEINKAARKAGNPGISTGEVDAAFTVIVKSNEHFRDWKNRLFVYFPQEEADFLNAVLVFIAHKERIHTRQLYDLARRYQQQRDYMELIDGLVRDGYIRESDQGYRFVSPFLQAYWKHNYPVYEEHGE